MRIRNLIHFVVLVTAVSGTSSAESPPWLGEPYLVADLNPGLEGSMIDFLWPRDDHVVFEAWSSESHTWSVWRSDGTPEGTMRLSPEWASVFRLWAPSGGPVFMFASERPTYSDGFLLMGQEPPQDAIELARFDDPFFGNEMRWSMELGRFFFAMDNEPWVSDTTPAGTHLLADLNGDGNSLPQSFFNYGERVFFDAFDDHEWVLFETDGTTEGTRRARIGIDPAGIGARPVNGIILVTTVDSGHWYLWASDGTSVTSLQNFGAINGIYHRSAPNQTFLAVRDAEDHFEHWRTDGTPEGTLHLIDAEEDLRFTAFRDSFFSRYDDGVHGRELWRFDPPGASTLVADICSGPCSGLDGWNRVVDDRLFLVADDGIHGEELWVSDGTSEGTSMLFDLCPGECGSSPKLVASVAGRLTLAADGPDGVTHLWQVDDTGSSVERINHSEGFRPSSQIFVASDRVILLGSDDHAGTELWAAPLVDHPPPPDGEPLESTEVPGYRFNVRVTSETGAIAGASEPACIPETLCVSGAVPGRSELFARVVGPKPNGYMWPTLVKFSTSTVEVWIEQAATGLRRYYRLEGATPGNSELPGLYDRTGFEATRTASDRRSGTSRRETPADPPDEVITSPHFADFTFRAQITSPSGEVLPVRAEPDCIDETLCLSGAVPGRSELFVRIVGPKPNGYLWPTLVKFSTSTIEVWIDQVSTGESRYYRLEGATPGSDRLDGLFDRMGFLP